jgi:hypothetical protein
MVAHDSGAGMEVHGGGVSIEACGRGGMEAPTAASRPSHVPPPPYPMEEHGDGSTTTSGQRWSGRSGSDERAGRDGSTTTTVVIVPAVIKCGGTGVQAALGSSDVEASSSGSPTMAGSDMGLAGLDLGLGVFYF